MPYPPLRLLGAHCERKMMKRFICGIFCGIFIVAIAVVIAAQAGYSFRTVYMDADSLGIESPNGCYELVETADASGQYLLFAVIQTDGPETPRTLFVTDDFWYHSSYIKNFG